MIERMKKITILVSERDRERFITKLRDEGMVHIKHVQTPSAHEIKFVEDKILKTEKMISDLLPYGSKGEFSSVASKIKELKVYGEKEILEDADIISEICKEKRDIEAQIRELNGQKEWFDIWGEFDPKDKELLRESGVFIRLYQLEKDAFKDLDKADKCIVLKKDKTYVYVAFVSMDPEDKLSFKEIAAPSKNVSAVNRELEARDKRIGEIDDLLKEKARSVEAIKDFRKKLDIEDEFLKVKFGMRSEEQFAYLQGFCPVKYLKNITAMAEHHNLGYLFEEADDPVETPTLITNPKWIDIIKPVFQFMNTVPGYEEFDISFVFMIFFSLFFAMIIGDAGYGLIFLFATLFARSKLKKAPPEPFFLMYLLSVFTIIWGAVTGTWFGAEAIGRLPFLNGLVVEKIDSFAGNNQNFIIYICFIIGAVHLTIAHLFRAFRMINSFKAVAQFGWISIIWGMFFAAGALVLGRDFPSFGLYLFSGGFIAVLFFTSAGKGWLKGIGSTLVELPLSLIGSFSDVVSYLRLFAVGYASVVLASTFNNMALEGGIHSVIGGVCAALILFMGHALNIVLGMMAVIVHGIRLNMLEFSSHIGMQWSGVKYDPFREK